MAARTRYPIILAAGIARYDAPLEFMARVMERRGRGFPSIPESWRYFKGIAAHLRAHGFQVAQTLVGFAAAAEHRARELRREVNRILQASKAAKVHIIGHSMGGLDARRMIVYEGMEDRVASLTTIGTPHFGSSFADWALPRWGLRVIGAAAALGLDLHGFESLTSAACKEFNERTLPREAANGVTYQTCASSQTENKVLFCLRRSWRIITDAEGDNDGLVSVNSQRWQQRLVDPSGREKHVAQLDFPLAADHLNQLARWHRSQADPTERGWSRMQAARRDYERRVRDFYLDIARSLPDPHDAR